MEHTYLALGLMSGTSVDGIDASLARYTLQADGGLKLELIAAAMSPFPAGMPERIFRLFEDERGSLDELATLDQELGELFAQAALGLMASSGVKSADIRVIGSHGQTIRHKAGLPGQPGRASLQIGSGAVIAQRTGIATACDFRPGDVAAGGTGAPLVPLFNRMLAKSMAKPIAFQNIGGIGNVCYIGDKDELIAFDTGPGNMIADTLAREATDGLLSYDKDGELGSQGRPQAALLDRWRAHPYLLKSPPKSTGREEFGQAFYREELATAIREAKQRGDQKFILDLVRSAEDYCALSIADAYDRFLPQKPRQVIVSGGGARNPLIMDGLRMALPTTEVLDADKAGLSVDYMEALAFGLFGLLRQLGLPNTEPRATGAFRAACAGALHLP
ncbi:MAG TPA: anhydro-N-acetylmuramic acid kinase [Spirochaetaceae bacterium]|nr:anhydro-N-acetylmuramic acid kinase [Spirochaetaceae bacterium]